MNILKQNYEEACNDYLHEFCERYEIDHSDARWIGGVGEMGEVVDYYFSMRDIIYCVDNHVEWDDLMNWYDYSIDAGTYGFTAPNLKSWLAGCPRKSAAEIEEIKAQRSKIEALKDEFEEMIKNK